MDKEKLKYELKLMIISECEKENVTPEDIPDDVELFSSDCVLELDSLDALQISMGLQNRYAIRLGDSKEFRRVVTNINELARFIEQQNA